MNCDSSWATQRLMQVFQPHGPTSESPLRSTKDAIHSSRTRRFCVGSTTQGASSRVCPIHERAHGVKLRMIPDKETYALNEPRRNPGSRNKLRGPECPVPICSPPPSSSPLPSKAVQRRSRVRRPRPVPDARAHRPPGCTPHPRHWPADRVSAAAWRNRHCSCR
jgi:hypothetical protein